MRQKYLMHVNKICDLLRKEKMVVSNAPQRTSLVVTQSSVIRHSIIKTISSVK